MLLLLLKTWSLKYVSLFENDNYTPFQTKNYINMVRLEVIFQNCSSFFFFGFETVKI